MIGLRMAAEQRRAVEQWAAKQEGKPTFSEAIRRLVELGLATARPTRQPSPHVAAKAREMATEQVERLMSPLLPEQERRARTRRLIKGPREFREMRVPKPKS
jgi:hypothetical protein